MRRGKKLGRATLRSIPASSPDFHSSQTGMPAASPSALLWVIGYLRN
jgi:hypothetical protein